MPNVALRGVPEPVHRRLKDAARANHRSMNGEILARLAASVSAEPATPEEGRDGPRRQDAAVNDADAAPRSAGAPMPVVAIPYEPMSEEELLERVRKLREEIDAQGGIDASPETIEALIQEGRRR